MPVISITGSRAKTKARKGYTAEKQLTAKQEAFARLVASKGATYTDAYKAVYDCENMLHSTIQSQASILARKPHIDARIKAIQADLARVDLDDAIQTRAFVMERLQHEALSGDTSSARIRALELLGKIDHVSMFTPKNTSDETGKRDSAQVKALLHQRLSKLLPSPEKE